jgi:hypothetical protein
MQTMPMSSCSQRLVPAWLEVAVDVAEAVEADVISISPVVMFAKDKAPPSEVNLMQKTVCGGWETWSSDLLNDGISACSEDRMDCFARVPGCR